MPVPKRPAIPQRTFPTCRCMINPLVFPAKMRRPLTLMWLSVLATRTSLEEEVVALSYTYTYITVAFVASPVWFLIAFMLLVKNLTFVGDPVMQMNRLTWIQ